MGADQSHEKSSKDWVDSNYASEESRGEDHKNRQSHHGLSGAVVKATCASQEPKESWADGVNEEQHVGDARE